VTAIVEGIYKAGNVELLQTPPGLREGRVRIILIADEQSRPTHPLAFGKYATGRPSTLEDFKATEWHGEAEFDQPNGQ
jgi:hypothetical protein